MLKTDQKKVPSQKYGFACSSRYNDLTFYEKQISHFTIPLRLTQLLAMFISVWLCSAGIVHLLENSGTYTFIFYAGVGGGGIVRMCRYCRGGVIEILSRGLRVVVVNI